MGFLVTTEEELNNVIERFAESELLAVDTETNITNSFHNRYMIGMSIANEELSAYFPVRHEDSPILTATNLNISILRQSLNGLLKNKTCIFHNAKFDLHVLHKEGIELPHFIHDTMLMSYLLNENESHKLKDLGVKYIDPDAAREQQILKILKKGFRWEQTPVAIMGEYACKDVELTLALYHELYPSIKEREGYSVLYDRELQFLQILWEMEEKGILIDVKEAKRLAINAVREIDSIEDKLGFDPAKRLELAKRLYSAPPVGLGLVAQKLGKPTKSFPKGMPLMDSDVLKSYDIPLAKDVLHHRELNKRKSVWYQGWYDKADPNGRLHPTFKQHGTRTSRLSCADPNMQQVPRGTEEGMPKTLLRSPLGASLWELDYSQVEFRLAAVYAAEKSILEGLQNDLDFHTITANSIGIDRQIAKTVNFLILYGGGAGKLSDTLGIGFNKAKAILQQFHSAYPNISKVMEKASITAQNLGYVKLWTGRRRHFVNSWDYHKAFNSVIQGGAAEIMKFSLIKLKGEGYMPVGQVHDSIWIELPTAEEEAHLEKIQTIMEWPTAEFEVPFPVDKKKLA